MILHFTDLRTIEKSSKQDTEYQARWYFRSSNQEDPWISIEDHHSANNQILYGENGYSGNYDILGSKGVDVYIGCDNCGRIL